MCGTLSVTSDYSTVSDTTHADAHAAVATADGDAIVARAAVARRVVHASGVHAPRSPEYGLYAPCWLLRHALSGPDPPGHVKSRWRSRHAPSPPPWGGGVLSARLAARSGATNIIELWPFPSYKKSFAITSL